MNSPAYSFINQITKAVLRGEEQKRLMSVVFHICSLRALFILVALHMNHCWRKTVGTFSKECLGVVKAEHVHY